MIFRSSGLCFCVMAAGCLVSLSTGVIAETVPEAEAVLSALRQHTLEASVEGTEAPQQVHLGIDEEWPAVLGDPMFLLEPERAERLKLALRAMRAREPSLLKPLDRVVLQQEIWAAFDQLYLIGLRPDRNASLPQADWHELLFEMAKAIQYLALDRQQIESLSDELETWRYSPGASTEGWVEFYSLEDLAVHDQANRYRRVTRSFYLDPKIDFLSLNPEVLERKMVGGHKLGVGARTVVLEQALAVTRDAHILPTAVSPLVRWILVDQRKGRRIVSYEMRRLELGASGYGYEHMTPFDAEAMSWRHLDLPNVPPKPGLGVRVPLVRSCTGCHINGTTMGLTPRPRPRQVKNVRFVRYGNPADREFLVNRLADLKKLTPEFVALSQYMIMTEKELQVLMKEAPLAARSSGRTSVLLVLGYACLGIWTVIGLWAFRLRSK